jgi:peptide deformylase
MAELLDIAQLGNPVLREMAQPIDQVQADWVQRLIDDMLLTLREANAVGIAAPQVGRSLQLLIIASRPNLRYPHAPEMEPVAMINPHIVSHSEELVEDWEGCLSIPGMRSTVPRYREIDVEYTNRDGKLVRQEFSDFVARIFLHEFDHLEGKVFLDRLADLSNLVTEQEYLKRIL